MMRGQSNLLRLRRFLRFLRLKMTLERPWESKIVVREIIHGLVTPAKPWKWGNFYEMLRFGPPYAAPHEKLATEVVHAPEPNVTPANDRPGYPEV